jgi:hypothetical protein
MRKYFVALVAFVLTAICSGGMSSVALALPAGHVPAFLIPFTKSRTTGATANSVTVITITRVSGTLSCDVSVDWRDDTGTVVSATSASSLSPPSATSNLVGDGDEHCSHGVFSSEISGCGAFASPSLTNYQGKAVVGVKSPCGANNLAVDARVIYLDPDTGVPLAIHSLKVLKPQSLGNKGE